MSEPTATDADPRHGGDLDAATGRFGRPADDWVDLSTGVNPWPYPIRADAGVELARFPTTAALDRLRSAARKSYRAAEATGVVAAAGSELLLRQLPHLFDATTVAIAEPTYGSHGVAWAAAGHTILDWPDVERPPDTAVLIVANPNNPDGRTHSPTHLARLARDGRHLIVDEAFGDLDPSLSILPHVAGDSTIVLRSFGKFFGLPGLRLGFVLGSPAIAERLAQRLGDWPVSAIAASVGAEALADSAWQAETRTRLAEASERLRRLLDGHGLTAVGRTHLFHTVANGNARQLHERLARRGILTRLFDECDWVRFGLPGSEIAWGRLASALTAAGL